MSWIKVSVPFLNATWVAKPGLPVATDPWSVCVYCVHHICFLKWLEMILSIMFELDCFESSQNVWILAAVYLIHHNNTMVLLLNWWWNWLWQRFVWWLKCTAYEQFWVQCRQLNHNEQFWACTLHMSQEIWSSLTSPFVYCEVCVRRKHICLYILFIAHTGACSFHPSFSTSTNLRSSDVSKKTLP